MKNRVLRTTLIIVSFLLCIYDLKIIRIILTLPENNYLISILNYLSTILIIIISLYLLHKIDIIGMICELDLDKGFLKGLSFAIVATLPMTVSSALLFKISDNIFSVNILFAVLIGPIMEEILFRGFFFGQLFKRERWGFIPSSVIASIFFGIGHLYQSHDLASAVGTFLVTFIGSAWFAWLYIEHNSNLWVPIWLHILMNLSWAIFQTDTPGAIGNDITNLFRVITIIITVVYTLRYSKKNGMKINKNNLFINQYQEKIV